MHVLRADRRLTGVRAIRRDQSWSHVDRA
jgi:hypothetical protein